MNKTPAAEDIKVDEKIPPGTIDQLEPTNPERPRHADQEVQKSNATEAGQRVTPGRRPLFRT
ncbi:MAG: hypothetical protein ABIN69_05215 [Aestuariivirga sp.]|jgi:hypothetical protein